MDFNMTKIKHTLQKSKLMGAGSYGGMGVKTNVERATEFYNEVKHGNYVCITTASGSEFQFEVTQKAVEERYPGDLTLVLKGRQGLDSEICYVIKGDELELMLVQVHNF